jgi:hypothetical protein
MTPEGAIQELAADAETDEAIASRFGADEVVRPTAKEYGHAICLDGPQAGTPCYAVRKVGSRVLFRGSEYAVEDASADPITLRHVVP